VVNYLSPKEAATKLGCSVNTIARAAKKHGYGVVAGNRFVAITNRDADRLKKSIHDTPGNPEWIAAKK